MGFDLASSVQWQEFLYCYVKSGSDIIEGKYTEMITLVAADPISILYTKAFKNSSASYYNTQLERGYHLLKNSVQLTKADIVNLVYRVENGLDTLVINYMDGVDVLKIDSGTITV